MSIIPNYFRLTEEKTESHEVKLLKDNLLSIYPWPWFCTLDNYTVFIEFQQMIKDPVGVTVTGSMKFDSYKFHRGIALDEVTCFLWVSYGSLFSGTTTSNIFLWVWNGSYIH